MQKDNSEILKNYYTNTNLRDTYILDNVTIKPTSEFEIKDIYNNVFFKAYLTHPEFNKRM